VSVIACIIECNYIRREYNVGCIVYTVVLYGVYYVLSYYLDGVSLCSLPVSFVLFLGVTLLRHIRSHYICRSRHLQLVLVIYPIRIHNN